MKRIDARPNIDEGASQEVKPTVVPSFETMYQSKARSAPSANKRLPSRPPVKKVMPKMSRQPPNQVAIG